MQTFLPFPSFTESAQVLDRQRLGKQRVEVLQLLRTLAGETAGWVNHPAARMWKGYSNELVLYGILICEEWIKRGYKDTCLVKISAYHDRTRSITAPPWRGDDAFHASHRSILLAKNPTWYGQFGWTDRPATMVNGKWPYIWPDPKEYINREQVS